MAEYKIAYPVKVHRPPWRDGPVSTIIDANGCEIAREIEHAFAEIIVADMNAAEEHRLLNKIFAEVEPLKEPVRM